jgi:hypothetical protein
LNPPEKQKAVGGVSHYLLGKESLALIQERRVLSALICAIVSDFNDEIGFSSREPMAIPHLIIGKSCSKRSKTLYDQFRMPHSGQTATPTTEESPASKVAAVPKTRLPSAAASKLGFPRTTKRDAFKAQLPTFDSNSENDVFQIA